MSKFSACWQSRRVLITGGTGFIGSHLSKFLHAAGAEVFSIDIEPPHAGTLFAQLNAGTNITSIEADLSQPSSIEIAASLKPDFIFHLAATPYAPYTTSHPREAYAANVTTTVNMLEAARLSKAKFILASSACIFGASQHSPLGVKDAPYKPEHYYSITKQDAERQVLAFRDWFTVPTVICRLGNVYGPGDRHFGRIVPHLCQQLLEDQNVFTLNRSKGTSVFEFLHVEDAAKGLAMAAQDTSDTSNPYHFSPGPTSRSSIVDLAKRMSVIFDGREREIASCAGNLERRVEKYLDPTETKETLGWKADWELNEGLKTTIQWYSRNIRSLKPHDYN